VGSGETSRTTERVPPVSGPTRIPVLMYHRVGVPHAPDDRTYCITPARFESHMRALEGAGYTAVPIETLVAWLEGCSAKLPARPFVLTFDDGFADLHRHAWPLLHDLGWPATIFLVTGLIGDHDRWMQLPGRHRPRTPLLTAAQVAEMAAAGIRFHSHSSTHADLVTLSGDALTEEIARSRQRLGELLGRPVDCFAYPFGHHDERVVAAVKAAGYRAAFSVLSGFNQRDADRWRIRRLDVFGTDTPRELLRKVRLGTNDGSLRAACRYYWRRLLPRAGH
jgi:peptidoglycan/xylan/chitin deacetylase (PgdA/CDA1 family)